MNTEKRNFNQEAASWDEHPARVRLAQEIARSITEQVILTPAMNVLDFGCGTGLFSLHLQPFVRSITGVDSSRGMLDVFKEKIAKLNRGNVHTSLIDIDKGDTLSGNYDLVVSSMTIHHIKDLAPLFNQFFRVTAPGGCLCIADLDLDNGQFHDDNTGVFHCGFDRSTLRNTFSRAGFDNVRDITATEVVKPTANGETKQFSVFLMIGQKRVDKTEPHT